MRTQKLSINKGLKNHKAKYPWANPYFCGSWRLVKELYIYNYSLSAHLLQIRLNALYILTHKFFLTVVVIVDILISIYRLQAYLAQWIPVTKLGFAIHKAQGTNLGAPISHYTTEDSREFLYQIKCLVHFVLWEMSCTFCYPITTLCSLIQRSISEAYLFVVNMS